MKIVMLSSGPLLFAGSTLIFNNHGLVPNLATIRQYKNETNIYHQVSNYARQFQIQLYNFKNDNNAP